MPEDIQSEIKQEIKEFSRLIKKYPSVQDFYIGRAYSYMLIGENKKALSDCKTFFKFTSKDKTVLMVAELLMKEIHKRLRKNIK